MLRSSMQPKQLHKKYNNSYYFIKSQLNTSLSKPKNVRKILCEHSMIDNGIETSESRNSITGEHRLGQQQNTVQNVKSATANASLWHNESKPEHGSSTTVGRRAHLKRDLIHYILASVWDVKKAITGKGVNRQGLWTFPGKSLSRKDVSGKKTGVAGWK